MLGAQRYRADGEMELVPLNRAWKVTNVNVGTSAARIVNPPLAQRRLVVVRNEEPDGGNTVFVGVEESEDGSGDLEIGCATPDLTEGYNIPPGEERVIEVGEDQTLVAAADGAATPIQVLEAA